MTRRLAAGRPARHHRTPRLAAGQRRMTRAGLAAVAVIAAASIGVAVAVAQHPHPGPAHRTAMIGTTTASGPLPALFGLAAGWRGALIRPGAVYVGEGGAPLATSMRWSRWTASGARGTGELHLLRPGCRRPLYECAYQVFPVTVTLAVPRVHGTTRYFAQMRWSYPQDLVQKVLAWHFAAGLWRTS